MKFLRRYLDEKEPTLKNLAKVVRDLEGCADWKDSASDGEAHQHGDRDRAHAG